MVKFMLWVGGLQCQWIVSNKTTENVPHVEKAKAHSLGKASNRQVQKGSLSFPKPLGNILSSLVTSAEIKVLAK